MIFDQTNIQCDGNQIKVIVSPAAGFDGARREIAQFKTEVNQRVDEVEDLVVGIGSGEGGKAYDSLADALAAGIPDNVVFQTPEGIWRRDSSLPEGAVFLRKHPAEFFAKGVFDTTATINELQPDLFRAIKRVDVYGTEPGRSYYLNNFGRNRSSDGHYHLTLDEVGLDRTLGAVGFNGVMSENPDGVTVIELSGRGSGLSGIALVDFRELDRESYATYDSFTDKETLLSKKVQVLDDERVTDLRLDLSDLENKLQYNYNTFPLEFGSIISSTGGEVGNTTRVRSSGINKAPYGDYFFEVEEGHRASSVQGYVGDTHVGRIDAASQFTLSEDVDGFRIVFQKDDGGEFSEGERGSLVFRVYRPDDIGYQALQGDVRRLKVQVLDDESEVNGVSYFKGKKLSVLGDSISYGFIPRNGEGYPGQLDSYANIVAGRLGMSFQNNGQTGSTLGAISVGDPNRSPFVYRYGELDDDASLILVMGGTNDVRQINNLGSMEDRVEDSFYGALHVLCLGILEKYRVNQGTEVGAGKYIILCTPIKLLSRDISQYVEAVKEVGAYYSIPVWDANNLSGINPEILRTVQGYDESYTDMYNPYITDGTHPTQEGHEMMANSLVGFIKTLR